jgi:hypothetical protein
MCRIEHFLTIYENNMFPNYSIEGLAKESGFQTKSSFYAVGGYQPGEDGVEDLSLWLRLSKIGELVSVPEVLFDYRIHPNSVTYTRREEIHNLKASVLKRYPVNTSDISRYRNQLGEAFSFYKTVSGSYVRIVLLIREILLVGSPKDRLFSFFCIVKLAPNLNFFEFITSIWSIWSGSRNRRKIRSIKPNTFDVIPVRRN